MNDHAGPAGLTLEDLFELCPGLPGAPAWARRDPALARAIDARRRRPGRVCARCGGRARPTVYLNASDLLGAPRWLDCCWPCYGAVTALAAWLPDDAEIIGRWEAWQARESGG